MATDMDEPFSWGEISAEPLDRDTPRVRRRAPRASVALTGSMRRAGATAVSVKIVDLSPSGFRVETHLELEQGDNLWVRLPGLESRHAKVAWAQGHILGCAFAEPLHPAVFAMIAGGSN